MCSYSARRPARDWRATVDCRTRPIARRLASGLNQRWPPGVASAGVCVGRRRPMAWWTVRPTNHQTAAVYEDSARGESGVFRPVCWPVACRQSIVSGPLVPADGQYACLASVVPSAVCLLERLFLPAVKADYEDLATVVESTTARINVAGSMTPSMTTWSVPRRQRGEPPSDELGPEE